MDLKLKGKTVLITGSTAGIGLAAAAHLLKEGAHVFINGRTQKRVDEAREWLKSQGKDYAVEGVAADFSKSEDVNRLIHEIPKVDILINNAGIYGETPFVEITDDEWFHYFNVNVMSGVRLSRHYFPLMIQQNWGRILFISSESAYQIPKDMIHYGMTKSAMIAVSRGLAELTKGTGVTVNAILPGPTLSEGVKKMVEGEGSFEVKEKEFFATKRSTSLLQRFAECDEVANLITYASSPLSSATNGAALRVEGGIILSAF